MSNLNIKSNAKLSNCYGQLIETIYRIEFPSAQQQPQIKALAMTCGWNIDNQLAENVVKISQPQPKTTASATASPETNLTAGNSNYAQVGFTQIEFNYKDDELALPPPELTAEEIAVSQTPEAQREFEMIRVAVANKSLGFSFRMHPMVQQYLGYYKGRGRQTMEVGLYRSGMFMRMARRIFREEGLPENIAWLGQVESAWKPTARSWAAAAGLWQFIPGTGARYGLRQNSYIDERNSFEKATRASAQYLKFLANRYGGNWELAMAAYNCGEGNTDRAIRRAGVSDFWAAYPYLPKETRNYVPNILATILIANNPNYYGFGHVRPAAPLQYEILRVPASTSLVTIAQLSDTTIDYIRYLNPEFRSNITPPEPYNVRVPLGRGEAVAAVMRKMPNAGRNATVATVLKGETVQNIANQKGVSVDQVTIVGNKAIVQQKGNGITSTSMSRPTNSPPASPKSGLQIYTAKGGETLAQIASRLGQSPAELANLNGINNINAPLPKGRQIRYQAK